LLTADVIGGCIGGGVGMNGDIAGAAIDQLFSISDILKKFEILDKSRNSVNFLNKSRCEMVILF